jgi:hypothetical protein
VVAVAGVMGGEHSGVTESTTDLVLECAWFDPASVRRTSRRLGLVSDSSYRFERTVDPMLTSTTSDFAAHVIREVCGPRRLGSDRSRTNDQAFADSIGKPRPPFRCERTGSRKCSALMSRTSGSQQSLRALASAKAQRVGCRPHVVRTSPARSTFSRKLRGWSA